VAVAALDRVRFAYPGAGRALDDVSLRIDEGETVALLGASGSGKSTLVRVLAGLVPHFHGGRFSGRAVVAGLDTRRARPSDLAGAVASMFQDPEDQVVLRRVDAEVAFGLENIGTPPGAIRERALAALAEVGAAHLAERDVAELSGGELQRVCLASALALRPRLLLLDEPTSQLDPQGADAFLELAFGIGIAVVCSEQRPAGPLARADRVLFLDQGRLVLDAPRDEALDWLAEHRPAFVSELPDAEPAVTGEAVCAARSLAFSYGSTRVLDDISLELRRGDIVALTGVNGSGKTTLGKLLAGLLEPAAGHVERRGRAGFLLQDPGRYVLRERADDEVATGIGGDRKRARAALERVGLGDRAASHPRDLSSGERERLAIAAVLATEPDLLVLDEPTRGVDPERKLELAALLREGRDARATLLITHDERFARSVADRTIELGRTREAVAA
jgi:energy-coupling factor transport system ATP-binding protein